MEKQINENMSQEVFCARALEQAVSCGVSPAEITLSSSESFSVRVREGKLEDYKVSDRFRLTLRGLWQGRIGTASTQALDEESLDQLITGVKESAELIENDEQDDILTISLNDYKLLPGLKSGLIGARGGEECQILFSGKYGFGKKSSGIVPSNSALVYKIWVESVSND